MKQPCIECGELYEMTGKSGYCDTCRPPRNRRLEEKLRAPTRGSTGERGYDWHWQQLSRRARDRQPWCTDCGTTEDLTADHSIAAWERRAAGKSIRLQDIDVVCRQCNADRGAARGVDASDEFRGGDAVEIIEVEVRPQGGEGA